MGRLIVEMPGERIGLDQAPGQISVGVSAMVETEAGIWSVSSRSPANNTAIAASPASQPAKTTACPLPSFGNFNSY
jgi:hypothetical protein